MTLKPLVMAVLLVVASGVAAVPATATQEDSASAESGAHVSFETTSNAIVDYTVNGRTVVENLSVQSESESQTGGGIDIGGRLDFSAAGLSVASSLQAGAAAEIQTDSGATITAHDNQRGVVVVRPGEESQVVRMGVSAAADAESQSDQRAVVTTSNGSQAAVIATGDGSVEVTEDGNVSARTGSNGEIVYRQYESERSEDDETQEEMIANGTATAEVYVQEAADSGEDAGEDGAERTANVVQYGEDTSVEVTQQTANTVNASVERSQSEGRAVIMTVSDQAFESAENAEVYVDGEAAVRADSYGEIQSATNDGANSAFLVQQSTSAEATTDVVVGINHFSTREVSLQSDDSESDGDTEGSTDDGTDGSETDSGTESTAMDDGGETENSDSATTAGDEGTSSGDGPGFGVTAALVAFLGLALLAGRRR